MAHGTDALWREFDRSIRETPPPKVAVGPKPTYGSIRELMARALAKGGTLRGRHAVKWDIAGNCLGREWIDANGEFRRSKIVRTQYARAARGTPSGTPYAAIDLVVRCRKCEGCLAHRAWCWRYKARRECAFANRTWFGTLTFDFQRHIKADMQATIRLRKEGRDFASLSDEEKFAERTRELGRDLTLWLKRLRQSLVDSAKRDGRSRPPKSALRYIIVTERVPARRKDGTPNMLAGRPHFHALIHEMSADYKITWAAMDDRWQWFSSFKLVPTKVSKDTFKAVNYVTKYLTKEAITRVRVSFRYGHGTTSVIVGAPQGGVGGICPPIPSDTIPKRDSVGRRRDRRDQHDTSPEMAVEPPRDARSLALFSGGQINARGSRISNIRVSRGSECSRTIRLSRDWRCGRPSDDAVFGIGDPARGCEHCRAGALSWHSRHGWDSCRGALSVVEAEPDWVRELLDIFDRETRP